MAVGIYITLAGASPRRKKIEDYVREINQRLIFLETPTRIVDWYHSTGNFVVQSPITNRWMISDELSLAFGVPCTVQTIDEVASWVSIAERAENPLQTGIRWAKGIAFELKGKPCTITPKPTPYAVFFHINRFALGVCKAERVSNEDPESDDRSEDWGTLSDEISKQVGGMWTARSLARLNGVITKARKHNRPRA